MLILAIETSCDETAVAIVKDGHEVLSNVIASQADLHAITGGVVPEVAAREHVKQLPYIYKQALDEANCSWDKIDAIAATTEPGLIGALLIGIQTAKTLASIHKKEFIPVNHIYGHIFSNWLGRAPAEIEFPVVTLTVSGGHNNLYLLRSPHEIELLGQTQDDAAGEAFDKVAKMLNLGYPGGPLIAKIALNGDKSKYDFPIAKLDSKYNFSFSGLKTAVLYTIRDLPIQSIQDKADIAASFEFTVAQTLTNKLLLAAKEFNAKEIHLAGGVSANITLRNMICDQKDPKIIFRYPTDFSYCTDNAAMIAAAAFWQQKI